LNDRYIVIHITALLLLLAGCATKQPPSATSISGGTQDSQSQGATPPDTAPSPGTGIIVETVPLPPVSGNHAVLALLDRARIDTGTGQREAAGSSLERALRIEPRNAWLWHELAQLRLAQGQYAQAISMANKSISFAGRERRLLSMNWRVIGNARVSQGNPSGAEQAFKLAEELEK